MRVPVEVVKIAEGIKTMRIRGAGRIARAAARALKIAALEYEGPSSVEDFVKYMRAVGELLTSTRPTAVSLPNAVLYVLRPLSEASSLGLEELRDMVVNAAESFIRYSTEATKRIGEIGARRVVDGDVILTHCNSSAAISIIKTAHAQGKRIKVYATETRPRFQGYITARQLLSEGIPVTLIPDSAVRLIMKKVSKVIVGADTVAANGAVVNKIGTSQIALAAHEARVRVFVAAETYKFSPATVIGELVKIEERDPLEVVSKEFLESCRNVIVRNPAFDVTPPEYIDAIITEIGLIPPQAAILVLREVFGWAIGDHVLGEVREEWEDQT